MIAQLTLGKGEAIELGRLDVSRRERVLAQHVLSECPGLREGYLVAWRDPRANSQPKPALFVALAPACDSQSMCGGLLAKLHAVLGDGAPDVVPFAESDAVAEVVRRVGVRVYPSGLAYLVRWRIELAIGMSLLVIALLEWLKS